MYSIFWYTQLNFRGFGVLAVVFTSSSCICTHTTCFKISHRSVILKRFNICLCCLWDAQCVCILVYVVCELDFISSTSSLKPFPSRRCHWRGNIYSLRCFPHHTSLSFPRPSTVYWVPLGVLQNAKGEDRRTTCRKYRSTLAQHVAGVAPYVASIAQLSRIVERIENSKILTVGKNRILVERLWSDTCDMWSQCGASVERYLRHVARLSRNNIFYMPFFHEKIFPRATVAENGQDFSRRLKSRVESQCVIPP